MSHQEEILDVASTENPGEYEKQFIEAMNDDLNTPNAIAVIHNMLKTPNLHIENKVKLLEKWDSLLRIGLNDAQYNPQKELVIEGKIKEYIEFRDNKQFVQSDALRKEIEALGYSIRDTEQGPYIVKKFF